MIKIIHPPACMKPRLMHLWNTCFTHDEDFCQFFFDRHFAPRRALAVTDDDDNIYAALHFFDGLYKGVDGSLKTTWYIYGVATYPLHRKKGYATMLLNQLKAEARNESVSLLYLTAETCAWHLYESIGFCRIAELSRTVIMPQRNSVMQWKPCPLSQFKRLRSAYTDTLDECFLWRGSELEFMYMDLNRDGETLSASFGGQEYYAAVRLQDGELTVTETNFPRDQGDMLAGSIADRFRWTKPLSLVGRKDEIFTGTSVLSHENFYKGHIWPIDRTTPSPEVYMNLLAD